jgi:hypothetical protein
VGSQPGILLVGFTAHAHRTLNEVLKAPPKRDPTKVRNAQQGLLISRPAADGTSYRPSVPLREGEYLCPGRGTRPRILRFSPNSFFFAERLLTLFLGAIARQRGLDDGFRANTVG